MILVPASREITASRDAQALRYSTAREKAEPDPRQLGQQAATTLLNKTPDVSSQRQNLLLDNQQPQANDTVRVSSTLGKAASSGMLTKEEALAIYQKIAAFL
jgi:hypothetical protein